MQLKSLAVQYDHLVDIRRQNVNCFFTCRADILPEREAKHLCLTTAEIKGA